MTSSEQDKRLRAELAQGLGYFPASLGAQDVARYREEIAERKARPQAGERDGWEPGGYKWHKWDHLREEKQRAEVEARGLLGQHAQALKNAGGGGIAGETVFFVHRNRAFWR